MLLGCPCERVIWSPKGIAIHRLRTIGINKASTLLKGKAQLRRTLPLCTGKKEIVLKARSSSCPVKFSQEEEDWISWKCHQRGVVCREIITWGSVFPGLVTKVPRNHYSCDKGGHTTSPSGNTVHMVLNLQAWNSKSYGVTEVCTKVQEGHRGQVMYSLSDFL